MKRSGIGRLVRIVAIAAAIVLVGYGLFLAAFPLLMRWQLQPRVSLSEEQIKEIEARRDYFRIVGEVEFEGQRIAYDEIIQIQTEAGFISNMGQVRGDFRTLQSRLWVTRVLDKGGALIMEVPDAAGLWSDLEGRPPEFGADRPPPTFLPRFYWVDDLKNPTLIEGYVSEGYYEQPRARLKIVQHIKLEFVQASPEAEAKAMAQMREQPNIDFGLLRQQASGPYDWVAIAVYALPKTELATLPDLSSTIQHEDNRMPIVLDWETSQPLFEIAFKKYRWLPDAARVVGVPQPKRYPLPEFDEGILYSRSIRRYADSTIPAICHNEGQTCRLSREERGYLSYTKNTVNRNGTLLTIGNTTVKVFRGQAVILPYDEVIYLVSVSHL